MISRDVIKNILYLQRMMFSKFYDFIVPTFPDLTLCMTDTDSFLYSSSIPENKTFEKILMENKEHFDFSNLSKNGKFGQTLFSLDHKNELNRYSNLKNFIRYISLNRKIYLGLSWSQKMQKLWPPAA